MEKFFTSLMIGLLCCVLQLSAQQQPTFTITPQTTNAEVNDVLTFEVRVSNFVNIATTQFGVNWDPAILEFVAITTVNNNATSGFPGLTSAVNGSFSTPGGNVPAGQMGISWNTPDFTGISRPDGTLMFAFQLRAKAGGNSMVFFAGAPTPGIEVLTGDFVNVGLNPQNASVTVSGGGSGDPDFTLSIGSANASQGGSFCVPVTAENFIDVVGMAYTINYNASQLTFTGVQNLNPNLPGFSVAAHFGTPPALQAGFITVNYFNQTLQGIDLPNGAVLFELCFTAASAGTSSITFSNAITPIEISDSNENIIPFNSNPGSVTITGGGGGGDFLLTIEDKAVVPGQSFCVKVTADNFNDVVGMSYTIQYNSSQLAFTGVQNLNPGLPGFSAAANFGTPNSGLQPGFITVNYFNQTLQGIDLPNGAVLFELCFDAIGSGSSSNIFFSSAIAQIEISDSNENIIPFNSEPGTIDIGGSFSGFRLTIEDKNVMLDQEFCVQVTTENFTDVVGMAFTMNYNPARLQFISVSNLNPNLPGFSVAGNFGTPPVLQPGFITANYFNQTLQGIDLPNGAVLFELCFRSLGPNGSCSDITFSSDITEIEISDSNQDIIPFNSQSGTICTGNANPNQVSLTIGGGTFDLGQNFCVPITANSFMDVKNMSFTITYNPAELSFASVTNLTGSLPGFTIANSIGTPASGTAAGIITVNWSGAAGVTLPANTVLFQLCFEPLGQGGNCTDLNFSGTPTPIQFQNGNNEALTFNGTKGTVCINPAFDGFLLTIQDRVVQPNQSFCVPVTVLNFEDVVGLAFTIQYNATHLQFQQVTNLNPNLAGFSVAGNFGLPPSPVPAGNITMSWFNSTLSPTDLNNGDTLFVLCFTAIGSNGAMSNIFFSSAITPIEVSDSNQEIIPFNSQPGQVTISAIQPPALGMPTITNVNCFGQSTGAISMSASGGSGQGFTYAWSNGMSGASISGLAAGSYTVTVSDIGSPLTSTATYNVTQPAAALAVTGQATAPSCSGGTDGSITTSVTGGTPPYSYAWTGGIPANTANPTGLPAGSYTLTVTDSRGCTTTQAFSVPAGGQSSINIAAAVNNVTCFGANDGSITLSVSGIQGTPTYFWTPNNLSGSAVTNLAPGNYSVTVFDAGGCSRSQAFVITGPTTALEIVSITPTPIQNMNDGAVNIVVTGGQSPYSYNWSGPNSFTSSAQNLTGLSTPGQYCVTVTDARNCVRTACAVVIRPLRIASANVTDACFAEANGSINVTVAGGMPGYSYNWGVPNPPPPNSATASGLNPGVYFLTVTDSAGEQIVVDFEVEGLPEIIIEPNSLAVTGSPTNCNAAIMLNASGGTGTLSYSWSNGATTPSISGLCLGSYCVTITDQRGCVKDTCFNVIFVSPLEQPEVSAQNARCWDTEDGSLTINIIGGLPPYSIVVTNESGLALPTINTSNTTYLVSSLPAGTYEVEITDLQGNTRTVPDMVVAAPSILTASIADYQHDVFGGTGCSGMIQLGVSGGTGGYTVNWSNGGGTGVTVDDLCGDTYYQATITDANGCSITMEDSLFISVFRVEVVSVTGITCPEDEEGEVELSVSGGDPGYTYRWLNAAGQLVSEVQSPNNLTMGIYTLMVSEPSGNVVTLEIEIESASQLGVAVSVESDFNGFDVSCFNTADGIVRATASGSSSYVYEWIRSSDNTLVGSGPVLTGAPAGTYQLHLSGAEGCLIVQEFSLDAPDTLRIIPAIKGVSCTGGKDGSILVNTIGGIPGFGYNYEWSNGEFGNRIGLLGSGTYTVTVIDANGCEIEQAFALPDPAPIEVEFAVEPATDGCNGAIRAMVASGADPISYNWLNIDRPINESMAINLCPGDYFLQVTDANGCRSSVVSVVVDDRRFPCLEERVVITPNGDGANDQFIIFCIGDFPDNQLQIFNRWGQLVFRAENYNNTWEGTTQDGKLLPEGPYYYVLEFTDPEGKPVQQKGSLTILRDGN